MSGDRYGPCLVCAERWERKKSEALAMRDEAYGKVTAKEYAAIERDCAKYDSEKPDDMAFREDYDISLLNKNTLQVGYFGICQTCGFEVSFSKKFSLTD